VKDEPAFPDNFAVGPQGDLYSSNDTGYGGLTKREYFAGLAMQGLINHGSHNRGLASGAFAEDAVIIADALLKELEREKD